MRYALYWLPHHQSSAYLKAYHWFNQTDSFQTILDTLKSSLSYYDFLPALKIPQKYGFHSEILPPFYLKTHITEHDIFEQCQITAKTLKKCTLKLNLVAEGKSLMLKSYHKSNLIIDLKEKLSNILLDMVEFDNDISYDNHKEFQIVLSNTSDKLLHDDLTKIAEQYWKTFLLDPIEIFHFSLCYQENKQAPFGELMQFNFKNL
jgi:hypothetical protein